MNQMFLLFLTLLIILVPMSNLMDGKISFKDYIKIGTITYLFSLIGLKYEFLITPIILISVIIQLKLKGVGAFYSIVPPFISVILLFIGNTIAVYITTNALKIGVYDIDVYRSDFYLYMIPYIFTFIICIIISKIIGIIIERNFIVSSKKLSIKKMIPLLGMLIITLAICLVNMFAYDIKIFTRETLNFNLIVFILYFVIILLSMKSTLKSAIDDAKRNMEKEKLKNLVEYTSTLESGYNEMRNFRHDYMNIITSIGSYIESDDMEGLNTFFNKNIIPLNSVFNENNLTLSKLKNIKIVEVKAIVSSKIIRAQELGIHIKLDILNPIEKIDMDIVDLCRILGILLDNAIEGALQCNKPEIAFGVIKGKQGVTLIIENNYNNEVLNISELKKRGFSTKGIGRGLGLGIFQEVISKYSNVLSKTKIVEEEFSQIIDIFEK